MKKTEYVILGKINIEPLLNMKKLLEKVLAEAKDEIDEMGAVQAFEVSYELAWHICQKVLSYQGYPTRFPRETFRLAAELGLIKDPEVWFDFMDKRNTTVHTYDIGILEEIYSVLPKFTKELNSLIKNLQKLK